MLNNIEVMKIGTCGDVRSRHVLGRRKDPVLVVRTGDVAKSSIFRKIRTISDYDLR